MPEELDEFQLPVLIEVIFRPGVGSGGSSANYIGLEDGSGHFQLEDGSGFFLME